MKSTLGKRYLRPRNCFDRVFQQYHPIPDLTPVSNCGSVEGQCRGAGEGLNDPIEPEISGDGAATQQPVGGHAVVVQVLDGPHWAVRFAISGRRGRTGSLHRHLCRAVLSRGRNARRQATGGGRRAVRRSAGVQQERRRPRSSRPHSCASPTDHADDDDGAGHPPLRPRLPRRRRLLVLRCQGPLRRDVGSARRKERAARSGRRRRPQFFSPRRPGDQRLCLLRSRQAGRAALQGGRLGREQSLPSDVHRALTSAPRQPQRKPEPSARQCQGAGRQGARLFRRQQEMRGYDAIRKANQADVKFCWK